MKTLSSVVNLNYFDQVWLKNWVLKIQLEANNVIYVRVEKVNRFIFYINIDLHFRYDITVNNINCYIEYRSVNRNLFYLSNTQTLSELKKTNHTLALAIIETLKWTFDLFSYLKLSLRLPKACWSAGTFGRFQNDPLETTIR